MITTNKKPDIPVNEKDVNAAFGSAMVVRKLLLSIAQATRQGTFPYTGLICSFAAIRYVMHSCIGETGHWYKRWLEMGLSRMR